MTKKEFFLYELNQSTKNTIKDAMWEGLEIMSKKELEQQRQREETMRRTDLNHNPILTVVG